MAMIEVERDGAIARLWLARPESHNALSPELGAELVAALGALAADAAVRVVILGGRGRSFCAGADIATMKASANATFEENLAEAERLAAMFAALAEFPKPVIGRVHGFVLGGGIGLVCACDIVVTAGTAMFGITEVRLGILPALISPYVLRRLGDRAARELMLTGERFDSDIAHRAGLVHHVVPDNSLDDKVAERAQELLKGAPGAQRRIKLQLRGWAEMSWEEYRAGLPRVLAEVRAGAEAKDGLAAFFEKREPGWFPDR
jgi:methylglutaconyl-CoA hydratase